MDGARAAMWRWRWAILALALAAQDPASAHAGTLRVGPDQPIPTIAEAARRARDGDEVLIAPGEYRECAVWRASRLRIAAAGPSGVEISGPVCQGKALFVIAGADVVIEGLTFRDAMNDEGNGAGIRAEGRTLVIRRSRFLGNQNGILTASEIPGGALTIEDSDFIGNGALVHECAHGLYAGRLAQVTIRRSLFQDTRICHHVKSRALATEILDSRILDGPAGASSYLVDIPDGGGLRLLGSTLEKGPRTGNRSAAVVIGAESSRNPDAPIEIRGNSMTNLLSQPTVFVRNRTRVPALLSGNRLLGPLIALEGPGRVEP
jgi:hypothetical protein